MQSAVRAESRARRAHSAERSNRRRTPSSSRIDLHTPQTPTAPFKPLPLYLSLSDPVAYISAAIALQPSFPAVPLLVPFPLLLASCVLLLIARPSALTLQTIISRHKLTLISLAVLALYRLFAVLFAVSMIGPVRALIALVSQAPLIRLIRRRRSARTFIGALLAITALMLIVSDASSPRDPSTHSLRVRERVMRTSAGRVVHQRLTTISRTMRKRVTDLPFSRRIAGHAAAPEAQEPALPPEDAPSRLIRPHRRRASVRRRLLAIVKGEALVDAESNTTNSRSNIGQLSSGNTANVSSEGVGQNGTGSTNGKIHHVEKDSSQEVTATYERSLQPSTRSSASLAVLLIITASFSSRFALEVTDRVLVDSDEWYMFPALSFLLAFCFLFPISVTVYGAPAARHGYQFPLPFSPSLPKTINLGMCVLVFPVLLHAYRRGIVRLSSSHRPAKPNAVIKFSAVASSLIETQSSLSHISPFRSVVRHAISALFVPFLPVLINVDGFTLYSFLAACILIFAALLDVPWRFVHGPSRRRGYSFSSGDLSTFLVSSAPSKIRSSWRLILQNMSLWFHGVKDFAKQAHSNRTSWQVLNFLILQTGMALAELVYATMTESTGLFSISADNFFCSIALAIGLFAIRASARMPSPAVSYGYSRVESVCGFANGVMLIYVAVLIVLESLERMSDGEGIAVGRAFSVCLLGITGNVLGLYFFPPETRRENHNVQGIYLHIWANTLAFAGMAVSTAITTAVPEWSSADVAMSLVASTGVVFLAIPLLFRAGRLLLLKVSVEKESALRSTRERLIQIAGVVHVSSLRVWNLTPNSLVACVRLDVSTRYDGGDAEILSRARAVFALMGIPTSQCTIQLSRVDAAASQSLILQ